MKKMLLAFLLVMPAFIFAQTLNDADIHSKLQKIKDNWAHLFETYKSKERPPAEVNFDDSYYTTLKFYNVKGTINSTNFDNNMSFRISSNDYKKATIADFKKAYVELAGNLITVFDFLETRNKQTDHVKELTLFEKGKDTSVPVANPNSPKYYIDLKFEEEKDGTTTSYSIFLYFTSKK